MRRTFLVVAIAGGLSALPAQTSGPATQPATASQSSPSPGTSGQTITGVLMDASCSAIANHRRTTDAKTSASASGTSGVGERSGSTVQHDGMTGANAQSTQGGPVARTRADAESREDSTETASRRLTETRGTGSGSTPERASATGTTGAATTGTDKADPASRRLTETRDTAVTSRSAGPDRASATGTTGAATNAAPPESGDLQSQSSVQGPGAPSSSSASGTGDRARTSDTRTTSSNDPQANDRVMNSTAAGNYTTVGDKYKECMVKPSTTKFAIHADGKLYVLDQASNEMVQKQMRNEAFRASMSEANGAQKWMSVTVIGTPAGDTLSITSVRK